MSKKIALILARSGSKSLKNKNMMFLNEKPLLFYTIDAAIKSNIFDKIILSTDSKEYINHCKKFYNIDFQLRSKSYSKDSTTTYESIKYIIHKNKFNYNDIICLLQPTSPLRNESHIIEAFKKYKNGMSVVSVSKNKKPSILNMNIEKDNLIFNSTLSNYNRNNEKTEYTPNGAIYIIDIHSYLKNKTFFIKDKTTPYIMQYINSVDIDDLDDFNIALWYLRNKRGVNYEELFKNKISNHENDNSILIGDSLSFNITHGEEFDNIENFGMPGISSTEYKEIFKKNITKVKCDNLFILIGTNDIIKDNNINLIDNINFIRRRIQYNNFFILEIPLTLYRNDRDNNLIKKLNKKLYKNYKKNYVRVNDILSTKNNLKIEYTLDGLHLNDKGNIILKKIITKKNK